MIERLKKDFKMAKIVVNEVTFNSKREAICFFLSDSTMKPSEISSLVGCSEVLVYQTKKSLAENAVVEVPAVVEVKVKKTRSKKISSVPGIEVSAPVVEVEVKAKIKRRTKAEMAAASIIEEPVVVEESVVEVEVKAKRKRRTKAEMALANEATKSAVKAIEVESAPVASIKAETVVVEAHTEVKQDVVKYVIGYADAYRINQFKDLETYSALTKEEFLESARQIYKETPDVKYIYVECYYVNGDHATEVIYKNPRKDTFSVNRLWA